MEKTLNIFTHIILYIAIMMVFAIGFEWFTESIRLWILKIGMVLALFIIVSGTVLQIIKIIKFLRND